MCAKLMTLIKHPNFGPNKMTIPNNQVSGQISDRVIRPTEPSKIGKDLSLQQCNYNEKLQKEMPDGLSTKVR